MKRNVFLILLFASIALGGVTKAEASAKQTVSKIDAPKGNYFIQESGWQPSTPLDKL